MTTEIKDPKYLSTLKADMEQKLDMVKYCLKNDGQSYAYHSFMTQYLNLHRTYLEITFFLESGKKPPIEPAK